MKIVVFLSAILCGAVHAADVDWAGAQLVTVQLIDDKFVPDKLVFKQGTPYRLRLENRGEDVHEFTAPGFLATLEVRNREVLDAGGKEIALQPGQKKELYFIARRSGKYPLVCANHDWDGMDGEITVEP